MGRSKKCDCEPGAPGWIVTFSDMMSLLLTFFILLLSFSTISEEEFNQAMMSLQGAFGVLPKMSGVVSPVPRPSKDARDSRSDAATRLKRRLQVEGLEKQVKVEYDAMGGIKISLPNSVLFDAGSATLRPDAYPVLRAIGEVLAELPDAFFEVRGHTDALPVTSTTRFRDNYDLSYFRAHAVGERLVVDGKVPMEQFEIVSCGPSQPLATNDTEEGRTANRRVEIFVRGLVDKSKIESLRDGTGDRLGPPAPQDLPISPRELNELR